MNNFKKLLSKESMIRHEMMQKSIYDEMNLSESQEFINSNKVLDRSSLKNISANKLFSFDDEIEEFLMDDSNKSPVKNIKSSSTNNNFSSSKDNTDNRDKLNYKFFNDNEFTDKYLDSLINNNDNSDSQNSKSNNFYIKMQSTYLRNLVKSLEKKNSIKAKLFKKDLARYSLK